MKPFLPVQCTPLRLAGALLVPNLCLLAPRAAFSANIAPEGTAIFGVNNAVDSDGGTERVHTGMNPGAMNDSNPASRVDGWLGDQGGDGGNDYAYAGVTWTAPRTDKVTVLTLTLATFGDGGWFGTPRSSPPAGGTLTAAQVVVPTVQVTSDAGATWTTVAATSNYAAVMTGHQIGGGSAPNPTSKASTFTLTTPQTGIDGIRLIGPAGGVADNGFLGIFELEIESSNADSDNDGMDDEWESANGLAVGTNDAALDKDNDGLTNLKEYQMKTDPQNVDTDNDGLNDGPEVNTHLTDPLKPDTDGDTLSDGQEVNDTNTKPLLADTDGDGLSDGQEVNTYHTDPVLADTDGDGYSDAAEVRLFSDPLLLASVPANIAPSGTAIIGTSTAIEGGTDTPYSQQNAAQWINDALTSTRVDTFNGGQPHAGNGFSYVGITWPAARTIPVDRLDLTQALFRDGGWFGPSNAGPQPNGTLVAEDLMAPTVQITLDGTTWTTVESSSNYVGVIAGVPIPDTWPVRKMHSAFQLKTPAANIRGIRLIGPEGGYASGGFLGVWELGVGDTSTAGNANIARYGTAIIGTATDLTPEAILTPYAQQDTYDQLNDGRYDAYIDTFNGGGRPNQSDTATYAGIVWPAPRTTAVDRVEVTFNTFGDGGWFGVSGVDNSLFVAKENLVEPTLQVTSDAGLTWTNEAHTSNYLTALPGFSSPGGNSPNIIFALNNPKAGINGIRLIGLEGGSGSGGFVGFREFAVREVSAAPANIALTATGFTGTNDVIDSDPGRPYGQAGYPHFVNDGNEASRVDTFDGAGGSPESYAALVWPAGRPVSVTGLTLTIASFTDGGWFGPPGTDPGVGGTLTPDFLTAPTVQVMDSAGAWTNAAATSDYLTAMNGQGIGGGANPNPTSKTVNFTLTPAKSDISGVRIIGDAGGTASGGFLGVWEMTATGTHTNGGADSDGDGQTDAEEAIAGTNPNDPNSVLAIAGVARSGGTVNLSWSSVPGKTYQIQSTTDVATVAWANAGGTVPAAPSPAASTAGTVTLATPAPGRLFFRVLVVP